MGFLNVYNNFKDFNAHLSHAFKVTFFDNILDNDENVASFSVKSVTKPVFKLSTEEYTRELGNSRFVIPIIDFSSAHMSITFYESDNMAVQAYLSSIYGSIGMVPPPIKILLEEYDNSMCIRLSSKVYLAKLIELSLPGFNNDGPGSIQEITAEFNVMRVYDNLADLAALVDLKYEYNDDYEFTYKNKDFYIRQISARKPTDIKIDNITFTQNKWKRLQISKKKLVFEYETNMEKLKKILEVRQKVDAIMTEANLDERAKFILTTIYENEDGTVWTYDLDAVAANKWCKFDDLAALYKFITTKTWNSELHRNEGLDIKITEELFNQFRELSSILRNINPLKTELRNLANCLNSKQGTIEELKDDQDVIKFVNEHPEFKDEGLNLESIPSDEDGGQGGGGNGGGQGGGGQGDGGQGGAAPAPASGGNGGVPPGTDPKLVNTGYHYIKADGTMGKEIKFDPPRNGKLHIRNESIKETVIGTSTTTKYRNMTAEQKQNHEKKVIEAFAPIVLKIAKEKGVDERMLPGMFAQMMLESGWLTSYDSTKDVNNFFGLTGAATGTNSYVVSRTHEAAYELKDKPKAKDRQVAVIRAFSQYDNAEDAIRDWLVRTVLSNRYQLGIDGRSGGFQTGGWDSNDVHSYVKVMKNNGYATGRDYIKLVNDIIDAHPVIKNLKYEI